MKLTNLFISQIIFAVLCTQSAFSQQDGVEEKIEEPIVAEEPQNKPNDNPIAIKNNIETVQQEPKKDEAEKINAPVSDQPQPEEVLPWLKKKEDEEKATKEAAEKQRMIEEELKRKEEEERLKREQEEKEKAEKERAKEKEFNLVLRIIFDENAQNIAESDKYNLDKIIEDLKVNKDKNISIWSYASSKETQIGEARRLSLKRAINLRQYFVDKGIDPTRIIVRALGNSGDNETPADRIDISVVN